MLSLSQQSEIDFDHGLNWHWFAVLHAGLEFPLLHRFECHLIQTHPQSFDHANVGWTPLSVHYYGNRHDTRPLGSACLLAVLRLDSISRDGCSDPIPHAINLRVRVLASGQQRDQAQRAQYDGRSRLDGSESAYASSGFDVSSATLAP